VKTDDSDEKSITIVTAFFASEMLQISAEMPVRSNFKKSLFCLYFHFCNYALLQREQLGKIITTLFVTLLP